MVVSLAFVFIPLLVLIAAILWAMPRSAAEGESAAQRIPFNAARFLTYAVSFIGLMGFLFAVYGLLGLTLAELLPQTNTLISAGDARQQFSYYLAALIVATPIWIGFWLIAQRRVSRSAEERQAPERRLYFALVFALGAVVALFSLRTLLDSLFTLSSGTDAIRSTVEAGIRLLVYGGAWLAYTRFAWQERSLRQADWTQDLAVAVLSAFALTFLAIGAIDAISAIIAQLQGTQQALLVGTPFWGDIAAWIVSGGAVWVAVSLYDELRPTRFFRVAYLYLVLAVAVATTLISGSQLLYELVRRILGYQTADPWGFLLDLIPYLLVGAAISGYHWAVLRRQAALAGQEISPPGIPWPRRPAIAEFSFIGLAMVSVAGVSLLWLALHAILGTHDSLSGSAWWRDQLSASAAALLIGAALWLPAWFILQRAATLPTEQAATARRWLLGAIILVSTLIGVGFTIAFLWKVLQMVLGVTHGVTAVDSTLEYVSAAAVAAAIVAYHGVILRADLRAGTGRRRPVRIAVLLAPGAEAALAEFQQGWDRQIEILGYLTKPAPAGLGVAALRQNFADMDDSGHADRALLVLTPNGGSVYPYSSRRLAPAPDSAAGETAPATG